MILRHPYQPFMLRQQYLRIVNEWKRTCSRVKRGTTLSHSLLNENPGSHGFCISSQGCADSTEENPALTPRISRRASLVRARAFSRMNNQEQRRFIAQTFQRVDAQELVSIFKAVYGHPADKGRPRSQGRTRT